jgi:hypothetical protein
MCLHTTINCAATLSLSGAALTELGLWDIGGGGGIDVHRLHNLHEVYLMQSVADLIISQSVFLLLRNRVRFQCRTHPR